MSGRGIQCGPRQIRRAVTLLEVILALGILCTVTSLTYWFYSSSLETSRTGTVAAQKLRLARVVLDRMAKEIRQVTSITTDERVGLRGEPERIWLSSYRVPTRAQAELREYRDELPPTEYDLTKVEYKIVRHPEILHEDGYEFPLGLARIEHRIPRPDSAEMARRVAGEDPGSEEADERTDEEGQENEEEVSPEDALPEDGYVADDGAVGEPAPDEELFGDEADGEVDLGPDIQWDELYAPEIRYLRFCYFDGSGWWDSWDVTGENPLPQLVMVTIGFSPRPPFGEDLGLEDRVNDEFCECLLDEALDCVPLADDQFSTVVRVTQADPLFRSRVSRETQALMEELAGGGAEE
jgi:hypothetical protein